MTPPAESASRDSAADTVEDVALIEREPEARGPVHAFVARIGYWLPVIAVVILFAQVSFLGLRPALSEARRLAEAEEVLTARHAHACEANREIQLQLLARGDPVFVERQRRQRTIQPAPTPR